MKVSVILPSLNPDEKLLLVVNGLIAEGFSDIIIVNDGSDDEHMQPFLDAAAFSQVTLLRHDQNRGKGRALKTAYEYCMKNRPGLDGVVTVDGDNQHRPEDIRKCCEAMAADPDKVVLGCRDFSGKTVPWKSKVGNNITKAVFFLLCGIRISDTQTGLRAIPAHYLPFMAQIPGDRFEYETKVLLEMKRCRIAFTQVPIETVYIEENASTHFHWLKDSLKIYGVILRHTVFSLLTFFKFALGSVLSFLIDNGVFTLTGYLLVNRMEQEARIAAATAFARVISSVFNFIFNRKAVFRAEASVGKTLLKYYALCICQMAASAALVSLFVKLWQASGLWESAVKIVVDILLFLASYQIQKRWVFSRQGENRK